MIDLYDKCFGAIIQDIRTKQDIKALELASKLDLKLQELSDYENGLKEITVTTVFAFAEALNIKPTSLMTLVDNEVKKKRKKKEKHS